MEIQDLESRVRALEGQNRRLRALGGAVALGFAALLLVGQSGAAGKDLEAGSLLIRSPEGGRTIRLGAREDGSFGIELQDSRGKTRLAFRLQKSGDGEMALADAEGAVRIRAGGFGPDLAGIMLSDAAERRRTWWMVSKSDPVFDMFEPGGQTRLGLSYILKSDSAGISFFNHDGATRAGIVQDRDDSMRITLRSGPLDAERKTFEIRVKPDGSCGMEVLDPEDRLFARFGGMPGGGLGTYVGSKDGKAGFALMASRGGSVLQMGDTEGAKLAEIHALAKEGMPAEARGKASPVSLVLFDRGGKEVFRAPAPR